jgi:hypothetical protein
MLEKYLLIFELSLTLYKAYTEDEETLEHVLYKCKGKVNIVS